MALVGGLFTDMAQGQNEAAKYLYCIIKCAAERSFSGVPAIGNGDTMHTVVFQDLACVVSDTADLQYDNTRANLVAHEKVIEHVMGEFTVLPIRFGTVAKNHSGIPVVDIRHQLLERKYAEFHRLLQKMASVVELGLKALWRDEKTIFEEILAENLGIRKLRDSLAGRSPESTHLQRMRLGEMVKAALDRKRDHEAGLLLSRIRPLANELRQNKIIMDRMVLNVALLVSKEREAECDEVVKRLDEEFGGRMMLKYTGPNPPFNFCEIVVHWEEE